MAAEVVLAEGLENYLQDPGILEGGGAGQGRGNFQTDKQNKNWGGGG